MDAESVEPFLVYLPIPQRVVFLVLLGLWLWTWFLKVTVSYYDVSKVIISNESTGLPYYNTSTKIYQSSLKLFKSISRVIIPWQLVCIILFQYSFMNNVSNKLLWFFLNVSPLLELFYIFAMILRSSAMVARCFKRILWVADIEPKPYRNNYIIISDTLTSYSKPLVDLAIYATFLFHDPTNVKCQVERYENAISLNIDVLVGVLPSLIRMIQSLREFTRGRSQKKDGSQLFNAFKYAGNIPIMLVTVYTRYYNLGPLEMIYWFMFWNSAYSFWWDVTMDWKLELFNFVNGDTSVNNNNNSNKEDGVLRSILLYRKKAWYYTAMALDIILRFVWFWEYISGHSVFYGELNIFWLQILEIIRRWIWLFFKVEVEYIATTEGEKMDE
ncbi:Erd1 [Kluyveromyces lactis]|nr:Erd1 [Kluyveromyces lactis]